VFDPQGSGIINALSVTCSDAAYVSNGGFGQALTGVVLDPTSEHLFIADTTLHVIWDVNLLTSVCTRLAGTGTFTGTESGVPGPALNVTFRFPHNMTTDAAGNLYVIDLNNVLCLNRQATTQTILGVSIPSGNIANVAGTYNTNTSTGDGGAATSATFTTSVAGNNLAVDAAGNLYISDGSGNTNAHRVRKVDHSTGIISNFVGGLTAGHTGNGGPYTDPSVLFGFVNGICFDPAGNFYVADYQSSIRAINLQATTQTLYNWSIGASDIDIVVDSSKVNSSTGNGGQARAATVFNNDALQVDFNGVLYLSEPAPHSGIRAIDPSTGIITRVAGLGGASSSTGDGGPATSANINTQITIAVQRFAPVAFVLIQLTGGGYQDFLGNPLANGYLMMKINNPVEAYTVGNDVIEGNDIQFRISLDNNGNVATTPAQYVYSTSSLTPTCTYVVQAFAFDGTTTSAPQIVTVPNTAAQFNTALWVPNWPPFS
jgi:sugar lactone lactonase YvrE